MNLGHRWKRLNKKRYRKTSLNYRIFIYISIIMYIWYIHILIYIDKILSDKTDLNLLDL